MVPAFARAGLSAEAGSGPAAEAAGPYGGNPLPPSSGPRPPSPSRGSPEAVVPDGSPPAGRGDGRVDGSWGGGAESPAAEAARPAQSQPRPSARVRSSPQTGQRCAVT
ncbi:hypothetical protein Sfr7A_01815 [Streptomyces xinghaiensis]|uniref:Uncharacterized protein n=1 Tax=Streptomyces xinghaiensis TaxID=1038928 RepID=A0A3M8FDP3_9ACTN|nr:hypothetical protein Sfr7A_01815 [Streptomyces xinghaiensis]RKM98988.1 hypothetical protein SFRA_001815 [Streptomyces xinghaiensis]RNC76109.1 hypothetical protein DC095_002560 [Streptomyces xinghaiensis]